MNKSMKGVIRYWTADFLLFSFAALLVVSMIGS
jgi:hypothetical protein